MSRGWGVVGTRVLGAAGRGRAGPARGTVKASRAAAALDARPVRREVDRPAANPWLARGGDRPAPAPCVARLKRKRKRGAFPAEVRRLLAAHGAVQSRTRRYEEEDRHRREMAARSWHHLGAAQPEGGVG